MSDLVGTPKTGFLASRDAANDKHNEPTGMTMTNECTEIILHYLLSIHHHLYNAYLQILFILRVLG